MQHAYASEHLLPYLRPGARVLDVGSGSGYLVAVFAHLVGPSGKVVGIEHVPELVEWSEKNLRKDGFGKSLDDKSIEMIAGDGRKGYEQGGPYDAIHVGAAAPTVPQELIDQLASPGRMFIPVGTYMQSIEQIDKDANGKVTREQVMDVRVSAGSFGHGLGSDPLAVRPSHGQGEAGWAFQLSVHYLLSIPCITIFRFRAPEPSGEITLDLPLSGCCAATDPDIRFSLSPPPP